MNRKALLNQINKVDNDFLVSEWKLNGIDIWPIIKIKLFFKYYLKTQQIKSNFETTSKKSSIFKISQNLIQSILSNLQFFFRKEKEVDVLFSETSSHYSLLKNTKVSRFSFPIKQHFGKERLQSINVNFGSPPSASERYDDSSKIIYVERLAYYRVAKQLLMHKIFKKKNNSINDLKDFDAVSGVLSEAGIIEGKQELYQLVDDTLRQLIPLIQTYHFLLKKIQPRKIAEVCYYFNENFALTIAAHQRGIPTIDIMHGGMGAEHVAYANWEHSIPNEGYNSIPKHFAVWDPSSHALLQQWIKGQAYHQSIIIGNPWLDYSVQQHSDFSFPRDKTIVVYTMQYGFIEDYIYEAIAMGDEDIEWWIRAHPAKMDCLSDIQKACNDRSISERVNLKEANLLPLPIILKNCKVHLSEFSGSILEASLLNKYSIILNPLGVDMYQYYIDNGIVIACVDKNAIQLTDAIMQIVEQPPMMGTHADNYEKYEQLFKK